jgi:hypothetical protein
MKRVRRSAAHAISSQSPRQKRRPASALFRSAGGRARPEDVNDRRGDHCDGTRSRGVRAPRRAPSWGRRGRARASGPLGRHGDGDVATPSARSDRKTISGEALGLEHLLAHSPFAGAVSGGGVTCVDRQLAGCRAGTRIESDPARFESESAVDPVARRPEPERHAGLGGLEYEQLLGRRRAERRARRGRSGTGPIRPITVLAPSRSNRLSPVRPGGAGPARHARPRAAGQAGEGGPGPVWGVLLSCRRDQMRVGAEEPGTRRRDLRPADGGTRMQETYVTIS